MEKLSNIIADFYIRKNYITSERKQVYAFGFQLILSDIVNFAIIAGLSLILHSVLGGVIFLTVFCTLRQYSGGYHANTSIKCRVYMILTFLSCTILTYITSHIFNFLSVLVLNLVCIACIAALSPVTPPYKRITAKQCIDSKIKAIIISSVFSVTSCILYTVRKEFGIIITLSLISVVILMIIGIAVYERGSNLCLTDY